MTHRPPADLQLPGAGVQAISAGGSTSAAIQNGKLIVWPKGALCSILEAEPLLGLTDVQDMAVSSRHLLLLLKNGSVISVGCPGEAAAQVPSIVSAQTSLQIAVGSNGTSMALLADSGRLVAWGSVDELNAVPFDAQANVTSMACGATHAIALLSNGTVLAWGHSQGFGELSIPAELAVIGNHRILQLGAGDGYSLALIDDVQTPGMTSSECCRSVFC
jgi:alpha-tubulin suppressor-like RCC1 family protein